MVANDDDRWWADEVKKAVEARYDPGSDTMQRATVDYRLVYDRRGDTLDEAIAAARRLLTSKMETQRPTGGARDQAPAVSTGPRRYFDE